jgi:hypothetical protein
LVNRKSSAKPSKTIEFGSREFRQLAAKLASHNRQGTITLRGDILMEVDGESILVKGPRK